MTIVWSLVPVVVLSLSLAFALYGWRQSLRGWRAQTERAEEALAGWRDAEAMSKALLALSSSPYRNPTVHEFVPLDGLASRCVCGMPESDVLHLSTIQRITERAGGAVA